MSSRFSRRFFQRLWRFNAIVIAAVALMGLGYGALAGYYITRDMLRTRNVASIAPAAPAAETSRQPESGPVAQLETLSFSRLPDQDVMYAAMTSVDRMSVSYYSKEATNTRDYLFYDMKSGAFHRLIGRDDSLVAQMTFLSASNGQAAAMIAGGPAAFHVSRPVALLMTVVERDSDGDGRLSAKDLKTVAMAGPTGVRLTTVAREVKQLVGHAVGADGAAVVMVRDKDDVVRALRISIPDFSVTRDDAFAPGGSAPG